MNSQEVFYNIGYWLFPVLLAVWAIVMIVKKIKQDIKDTKEINKKIKALDQEMTQEK